MTRIVLKILIPHSQIPNQSKVSPDPTSSNDAASSQNHIDFEPTIEIFLKIGGSPNPLLFIDISLFSFD